MGRGSSQILVKKLMESLKKGPKSITEIAEETDLDRTAISKYLDMLKEAGVLVDETVGNKRIVSLNITFRSDTYFGLPLTEEQENLIDSIYASIKKYWKKLTRKEPLKTHVHKTLFKVNKECNLNLPMGWYLFGALCVKPFDPFGDYDFKGLPKKVDECIQNVVEDYSKNAYAFQTKLQQYKEEENYFYLLKEQILSYFYSCRFNKKSLVEISKKIRILFSKAPKPKDKIHTEDKIYAEILNEYQDLIIDFINEFNDQKLIELKSELVGSFGDIWKLIALYNYKKDLLEGRFYSEKMLDLHFKLDIIQQEREIIERCSELQATLNPVAEPEDETYKKLKDTLKSVKLKEKSAMEKSQDELVKEFGLD